MSGRGRRLRTGAAREFSAHPVELHVAHRRVGDRTRARRDESRSPSPSTSPTEERQRRPRAHHERRLERSEHHAPWFLRTMALSRRLPDEIDAGRRDRDRRRAGARRPSTVRSAGRRSSRRRCSRSASRSRPRCRRIEIPSRSKSPAVSDVSACGSTPASAPANVGALCTSSCTPLSDSTLSCPSRSKSASEHTPPFDAARVTCAPHTSTSPASQLEVAISPRQRADDATGAAGVGESISA